MGKYIDLGARPSKKDVRDYKYIAPAASRVFPDTFELAQTPVKNQGAISSCVAHALSTIMEYHYKQHHAGYVELSPGFLYGYRKDMSYKGKGLFLKDALKTAQKVGILTNEQFGYNKEVPEIIELAESLPNEVIDSAYPHRISTYFKITSQEDIKAALVDHGELLICMKWYSGSRYVDDVYTYDKNADYGFHGVVIYGWNEKGWLIQNSWGILAAGDGKFTLPFDYEINEIWGITDTIMDSDIDIPKKNIFLNFIYKIVNLVINLFSTVKK